MVIKPLNITAMLGFNKHPPWRPIRSLNQDWSLDSDWPDLNFNHILWLQSRSSGYSDRQSCCGHFLHRNLQMHITTFDVAKFRPTVQKKVTKYRQSCSLIYICQTDSSRINASANISSRINQNASANISKLLLFELLYMLLELHVSLVKIDEKNQYLRSLL